MKLNPVPTWVVSIFCWYEEVNRSRTTDGEREQKKNNHLILRFISVKKLALKTAEVSVKGTKTEKD